MKDSLDHPLFTAIDLIESAVIDVIARPRVLVLDVDAALQFDHPLFLRMKAAQGVTTARCRIEFTGVSHLMWDQPPIKPAINPDGSIDWGSIDSFTRQGSAFVLQGDFGHIELDADGSTIDFPEPGGPPHHR